MGTRYGRDTCVATVPVLVKVSVLLLCDGGLFEARYGRKASCPTRTAARRRKPQCYEPVLLVVGGTAPFETPVQADGTGGTHRVLTVPLSVKVSAFVILRSFLPETPFRPEILV